MDLTFGEILQFLLCLLVIYLVIRLVIWKWKLLFRVLRHPGRASFWDILLLLLLFEDSHYSDSDDF